MMFIIFKIPEATVEFESSRDCMTFSYEDLHWCFAADVTFNSINEMEFIELEVSLLGFLKDFIFSIHNMALKNETLCEVNDNRYDSYCLSLNLIDDKVCIYEAYSDKTLEVDKNTFWSDCSQFVHDVLKQMENTFTGLEKNNSFVKYRELVEKLIRDFFC